MPRKIRQLAADLQKAGWILTSGGKGSHRKFVHPGSDRKLILRGANATDAHPYQEKLVKAALREVRK